MDGQGAEVMEGPEPLGARHLEGDGEEDRSPRERTPSSHTSTREVFASRDCAGTPKKPADICTDMAADAAGNI